MTSQHLQLILQLGHDTKTGSAANSRLFDEVAMHLTLSSLFEMQVAFTEVFLCSNLLRAPCALLRIGYDQHPWVGQQQHKQSLAQNRSFCSEECATDYRPEDSILVSISVALVTNETARYSRLHGRSDGQLHRCPSVPVHASCAMKRPAPWSLEQPVMSRPSIELDDGFRADRTNHEIVPTSRSESKEVLQGVHVPLLAECNQVGLCFALKEAEVPVASGWTPAYLSWWQEQIRYQQVPDFFAVRLIGDANRPDLFSPFGLDHWLSAGMSKPSRVSRCSILLLLGSHLGSIAISTLLLHNCVCACSKWGHNRVAQHIGREQVLSLILPVETDPDIVCQAVSGLLGGFVKLSAANVEALLVLANYVGVSSEPQRLNHNCVKLHLDAAAHMYLVLCCSLRPLKRLASTTYALEHAACQVKDCTPWQSLAITWDFPRFTTKLLRFSFTSRGKVV